MYDKLIKRLRECTAEQNGEKTLWHQAADAIEELSQIVNHYEEESKGWWLAACEAKEKIAELSKPKWIMFESRPMDEEERQYFSEHYGYELTDDEALIYCSQLPDHDQEVLVCNKYGHIWIDRYDDDPDYGVGFETNGDMDGLVAWMPLPEPPKEET